MNKKLCYIIAISMILLCGCKNKSGSNHASDIPISTDSEHVENRAIETRNVEVDDNLPDDGRGAANVMEQPTVGSFEGEDISEEEASPFSWCSNFEPSDRDVLGQIVYEGSNDYYIIEDNYGYVIAESYSGWPSEGDQVYGNLNSFGFKWVVNTRAEKEYKFWIEDYGLSRGNAIRWMREHNHIK